MKVVFFETKDWERTYLRERLEGMELVFEEPGTLPAESAKKVLDAGALAQFPKVKLVATRSTGFDHIDVAYCRAPGIAVTNVPSYGEDTVAPLAVGKIFTF